MYQIACGNKTEGRIIAEKMVVILRNDHVIMYGCHNRNVSLAKNVLHPCNYDFNTWIEVLYNVNITSFIRLLFMFGCNYKLEVRSTFGDSATSFSYYNVNILSR